MEFYVRESSCVLVQAVTETLLKSPALLRSPWQPFQMFITHQTALWWAALGTLKLTQLGKAGSNNSRQEQGNLGNQKRKHSFLGRYQSDDTWQESPCSFTKPNCSARHFLFYQKARMEFRVRIFSPTILEDFQGINL